MRALIQRVREASVHIDGVCYNTIDRGLLVFLGVKNGDTSRIAERLAEKCTRLRIFEDNAGKMNLSVNDIAGSALVISQFTLYADTSRGHRPGFADAAPPESAEALYDVFVASMRKYMEEGRLKTGKFRALMNVHLINDGPVTISLDSE